MSEQQFSASLEDEERSTHFVLDAEVPATQSTCGTPAASGNPARNQFVIPQASTEHGSEVEQSANPAASADEASVAPDWREQVSAKVNSYKSRRPQKHRYPSLQLQFESPRTQPRMSEISNFGLDISNLATPVAAEPDLASMGTPIVLESTARVLEFPRPLISPVGNDELAEPVVDRPRIVEAPELLPPPPAMGGILIEHSREIQPERRPGIDLPLQSAALRRRLCAAAVDALLVMSAVVAFGYVFLRFNTVLPPWRTEVAIAAALLAILWPAYQYCLVVHSGTTPGLRLWKLQVLRFDGTPAPLSLRRWRVLASLLSALSLGLGYGWCFLDEDQLSWHDRITKTHLAPSDRK